MPDGVSSRIAVAFAAVGLVAALGVGAGLFVGPRTLHQEATISALGDVAQPVLARIRTISAVAELRPALAAIKAELRPEIGLYAIAGDRVLTAAPGEVGVEVGAIEIGRDLVAGQSVGGGLAAKDGSRGLYSAKIVRRERVL